MKRVGVAICPHRKPPFACTHTQRSLQKKRNQTKRYLRTSAIGWAIGKTGTPLNLERRTPTFLFFLGVICLPFGLCLKRGWKGGKSTQQQQTARNWGKKIQCSTLWCGDRFSEKAKWDVVCSNLHRKYTMSCDYPVTCPARTNATCVSDVVDEL